MGINYLWDTNIAIYYLQQQLPPNAEEYIDSLLINDKPIITSITEIELLCWKHATEKDENMLYYFINDCKIIELEQDVKYKTAEIRKQHRIKLPDAIIAASALVYNLKLITRNVSDFNCISNLEIINPWYR